jgi:hypothetical protein
LRFALADAFNCRRMQRRNLWASLAMILAFDTRCQHQKIMEPVFKRTIAIDPTPYVADHSPQARA